MEIVNILFYIIFIMGLATFMEMIDGFCYGLTGKLPYAHLHEYKKERRLKRFIAREERRKAREDKKKRT